jgi:hypothetical protein
MSELKFVNLKINEWKQFQNIEIDFHPNLTVLTGANGSGKTTILNLLAKHFGWNVYELATPAKDNKTGFFRFFSRYFKKGSTSLESNIGSLTLSGNAIEVMTIADNDTARYQVSFNPQYNIHGINIPSHRSSFHYQAVESISTHKRDTRQAYELIHQTAINRFNNNYHGVSPNYLIKETLLSWAISGNGNEFIEPDSELRGYYLEFQEILKLVLPKTLRFKNFSIRNYEIVLITDSGDFMMDAVSGGVSAIIDLAWQLFNFSRQMVNSSTVLIDEVENHLHATMQRSILPDIIKAFPKIQFIVSTHSPLIVGSVKNSNVYALRYNESNQVYAEKLDLINKAKSATEVLTEVLGVPFTMPIWVEDALERIIAKYAEQNVSKELFKEMRTELRNIGLEDLMPLALEKTIDKRND